MKRGWKIFWIVCGVCVGAGLVCCMVAFVLGVSLEAIEDRFPNGIVIGRMIENDYDDYDDDFDTDDYDEDDDDYDDDYDDEDDYDDDGWDGSHDGTPHSMEHTAAHGAVTNTGSRTEIISGTGSQTFTGVNSIDTELWGAALEVDYTSAAPEEIRVETENFNKKLGLKCYMDEDELKIVTKKRIVGVPGSRYGRLIIHIPKDYQFNEASLSLGRGFVHVSDIHAAELSVDVGAGEGAVENFTAGKAELKCGAGSMVVSGTADKKTEIDCGVGEVSYMAGGKEKDYNYKIDCGIGSIACGEASFSGIGAEKKIDNNAAKSMEITCGMGTVAVTFSEE